MKSYVEKSPRPRAFGKAFRLVLSMALLLPSWRSSGANEPSKLDLEVRYTNEVVPERPWSIHIVAVERGRSDLEFCTALGKGNAIGMGIVSDQVKSLGNSHGRPLAAINGDYYEKREKEEGRPRDLQIRFGEVISTPAGHTCFWISPDGAPRMTNVFSRFRVSLANGTSITIGLNQYRDDRAAVLYTSVFGGSTRTSGGVELVLERTTNTDWLPLKVSRQYVARVREVRHGGNTPLSADTMVLSFGPKLDAPPASLEPGAAVRIVTETVPDLTGVNVAIGGGPALVEGGKPMEWTGFSLLRHPRSAIGWNKDHIFMVEVDGRQSDVSIGMTFPEWADYMVKLGCDQAMNFDGGGSATLWAFGMVKNSPSEGEERPAPNALVLLKKTEPAR
ncbi:MAG: phosphodiester glycosidase family protein [Limisphaerales bacterium]